MTPENILAILLPLTALVGYFFIRQNTDIRNLKEKNWRTEKILSDIIKQQEGATKAVEETKRKIFARRDNSHSLYSSILSFLPEEPLEEKINRCERDIQAILGEKNKVVVEEKKVKLKTKPRTKTVTSTRKKRSRKSANLNPRTVIIPRKKRTP